MPATRSLFAAEARLDPSPLVGPPGIGKTIFSSRIAGRLGVRMSVVFADGTQDAMRL
jgi:Holliday junction resolvasome RuvABC ATP-dependent DNA helicase subunit